MTISLFRDLLFVTNSVPNATCSVPNKRNHVLDDGLCLPPPAGTADTPVLDQALLTELVTVAADPEFKMCFRLTEKHITVRSFLLCHIASDWLIS